MITKEQAQALAFGQEFFWGTYRSVQKVRVNGKCQTWVTRPDEFRIPLKFGFRGFAELTQRNAKEYFLTEAEASANIKGGPRP